MHTRNQILVTVCLFLLGAVVIGWGSLHAATTTDARREPAAGVGARPDDGALFHGFVLEPPMPADNFVLTDQHGETFDLSAQRDRVVVIFFGYTNCPDVCPATLLKFAQVKRRLGPDAEHVRFAFITVDPKHDTPTHLGEYVARFDASFYGLTGTQAEIDAVTEDYGVPVDFIENDASPVGYDIAHGSLSYVVDRDGNLRLAHLFDTETDEVVEDLRRLL